VVISCQVFAASLLDVSTGNCQTAHGGQIRNDEKSHGNSQQIRNGHGARVALCAHPMAVTVVVFKNPVSDIFMHKCSTLFCIRCD
jgi:hypothetical protein